MAKSVLFVSRIAAKVIRQPGWAVTCAKGSSDPNSHGATCLSQIVVLSWLHVFQTTKRHKWLTGLRKKLMKRLKICTLADICRGIMRLISDKYAAQIPKKFSYQLEHQRKTDLEMRVNSVN
jgi:L-arabinose isomerase